MKYTSSQSYHTLNHQQSNRKINAYVCGLGGLSYNKYPAGLGIRRTHFRYAAGIGAANGGSYEYIPDLPIGGEPMKKGVDIVNRARELKNYVYQYGGKRQKCTQKLADVLQRENPGVQNAAYMKKAQEDIKNGKSCCDCSGLVCYAYGIKDIGSYQLRNKYKVQEGKPRPGMIAQKPGHVAIIETCSGKIIEMRGIDYDYCDNRYRIEAGLSVILYDPNVEY